MKAREFWLEFKDRQGNYAGSCYHEKTERIDCDAILVREVLPNELDWKTLAEGLAEALDNAETDLCVAEKYDAAKPCAEALAKYRKATEGK